MGSKKGKSGGVKRVVEGFEEAGLYKKIPQVFPLAEFMCLYGYSDTMWPLAEMTDGRFIFRIFEPPSAF